MKQPIRVIGVPFALGGSKTGPARGPSILVEHGLISYLKTFCENVQYVDTKGEAVFPEFFDPSSKKIDTVHSFRSVLEVTKLAGARVFCAHRLNILPVVIGGDHSISMGTLPQFLDPSISCGRKVGLLWIDAHYDAHTPKTSYSHYANGLPFASVLGKGRRELRSYRSFGGRKKGLSFLPNRVIHIGAGESDCEKEEVVLLDDMKVKRVTMQDIHRVGASAFIEPLGYLLSHVDDLILTVDLDAIRKDFSPAVSFPSKNGMLPAHLFQVARLIAQSKKLRQIEIMEYNPDFEEFSDGGSPKTAYLVFDLLGQLLK